MNLPGKPPVTQSQSAPLMRNLSTVAEAWPPSTSQPDILTSPGAKASPDFMRAGEPRIGARSSTPGSPAAAATRLQKPNRRTSEEFDAGAVLDQEEANELPKTNRANEATPLARLSLLCAAAPIELRRSLENCVGGSSFKRAFGSSDRDAWIRHDLESVFLSQGAGLEPRILKPGDVLIEQGQRNEAMYFLLQGTLSLTCARRSPLERAPSLSTTG